MTLRQLTLFVAVAEELHFGRAARRLFMTQPGLTQQIASLERDLGCALFDRTSRRVDLTAAGVALLERARPLLEDAKEARHAVERADRGEVGAVRIGFVGTSLYNMLPSILRASRSRNPDLELLLTEAKTEQQLQDLRAGRLDVGFLHMPARDPGPGLRLLEARSERVGVALPDGHRLARRKRLRLAELAEEPVILFPRELDPDTHDAYLRACARAGFVPEVAYRATNLHTILGLVASGLGFGFIAASVSSGLRRRGIAFCALTATDAPTLTTALAWPDEPGSPAAGRFRELAAAMVQRSDAAP